MKLSIIIVDYKTTVLSHQLAKSLMHDDWEVIVVDNNRVNRGYGGGVNFGVAQSKGDYLLFLNPDVQISVADIKKLLVYLQEYSELAAVGPQFVDGSGELVPSSLGEISMLSAFIGLSFLHSLFPKNRFDRKFWLSDWDRRTTRNVGVINGACMMVRRKEFEQVGGFDESFFLYWEENDLCDRFRMQGKKITFLSDVTVVHQREVSVAQSEQDLSSSFTQSRSLYLRKRFGWFTGSLLNVWLQTTSAWRVFLLFSLSLIPRIVYPENISVIPDVMRDYREASAMILGKNLPLLGIPSSVPRFSQGPLNIWFDALAFLVGGISPIAPIIFAAIFTSIGAVLLYDLLKDRLGKNIAFVVSLLFVASPAAITQSRMPFYLFAIPIFLLFFLHSLVQLSKKTKWSVFFAVFSFCLLFQWELATIPFVAVLLFAFYRNRISIFHFWKEIVLAMVLGLLPQILYDVMHRCQQLCQFVVWMGYRTVAVSGIDGRHGLTIFSQAFWQSVILQLERIVGVGRFPLLFVLSVVMVGVIRIRRTNNSPLYLYTLLSTGCLFLGLVIHGDPSEAYFPPFLILLPILMGYGMKRLSKSMRTMVTLVLVAIVSVNLVSLISAKFHTPPYNHEEVLRSLQK